MREVIAVALAGLAAVGVVPSFVADGQTIAGILRSDAMGMDTAIEKEGE